MDPHSTPGHHHHEPVRAEPDIIPVGPVMVGGAAVLLVFVLALIWAYQIQRREEAALGRTTEERPAPAPNAFKYEVGMINQQQFSQETRAYNAIEQKRQSLGDYGWVDRKQQTAHVPLEEGMKKVIQQYGGQQ